MLRTGTEDNKEVKGKSARGCSIKRKKRGKEEKFCCSSEPEMLIREGEAGWPTGLVFLCASVRVKNKTVEVCRLLFQATESCCISEEVCMCVFVCAPAHAHVLQ